MIINKITPGFVVQQWDTKRRRWIRQEFIAGDDATYEYNDMSEKDVDDTQDPEDAIGVQTYLALEMVQPI